MQTFIDAEGFLHRVVGTSSHSPDCHFMITIMEKNEMKFPQLWLSNHGPDEVPVWIMRPENSSYTLKDILFDRMAGGVGDLSEYDFFKGEHK